MIVKVDYVNHGNNSNTGDEIRVNEKDFFIEYLDINLIIAGYHAYIIGFNVDIFTKMIIHYNDGRFYLAPMLEPDLNIPVFYNIADVENFIADYLLLEDMSEDLFEIIEIGIKTTCTKYKKKSKSLSVKEKDKLVARKLNK